MKSIAIFGHKGYIGRQLMYYFGMKGVPCSGFDVPECDITSIRFWEEFRPEDFKAVLFFSGLTGTERSFSEAQSYLAVNEGGLLYLLNRLVPLGAKSPRVVFPSSRLVYKGSNNPLAEDAEKETKTVYAVNKLACEGYLAAYSNRFGIPYNVIRICVPYGSLLASEYSYGTIGFFLKQLSRGQPITLFGGGKMERTFTHVEDICSAVELMVVGAHNGIYNVGGTDMPLSTVADMIAKQNGGSVKAVDWPSQALLVESGSTKFDGRALSRDFGWCQAHSLEEHIKEMTIA